LLRNGVAYRPSLAVDVDAGGGALVDADLDVPRAVHQRRLTACQPADPDGTAGGRGGDVAVGPVDVEVAAAAAEVEVAVGVADPGPPARVREPHRAGDLADPHRERVTVDGGASVDVADRDVTGRDVRRQPVDAECVAVTGLRLDAERRDRTAEEGHGLAPEGEDGRRRLRRAGHREPGIGRLCGRGVETGVGHGVVGGQRQVATRCAQLLAGGHRGVGRRRVLRAGDEREVGREPGRARHPCAAREGAATGDADARVIGGGHPRRLTAAAPRAVALGQVGAADLGDERRRHRVADEVDGGGERLAAPRRGALALGPRR